MFTYKTKVNPLGIFATLVLIAGMLFAPLTHAQTITQSQIDEQKRVVLSEILSTLQEHYKLLQMIYIKQLEAKLIQLQNQNK